MTRSTTFRFILVFLAVLFLSVYPSRVGVAEEPDEIPNSFQDDFATNSLDQYSKRGSVVWNKESIDVGANASLVRRLLSNAQFQCETVLKPTLTGEGQDATQLQLIFQQNRRLVVVIHRKLGPEGWVRQPEIFELRPKSSAKEFDVLPIRRLAAFKSEEIEERWKLSYDYGVLTVSFNGHEVGKGFSGTFGGWCHAFGFVQQLKPAALHSISFSGTPASSTPEQVQALERISKLSSQSALNQSLGVYFRVELDERKKLDLYDKHYGKDYYASGVPLQSIAYSLERQSQLSEAADYYEKAAGVFARSLGSDHPEALRSVLLANEVRSRIDPKAADVQKVRQCITELVKVAGTQCEHAQQALGLSTNILFLNAKQARQEKDYGQYGFLANELLTLIQLRHGETGNSEYHGQIEQFQFAKEIAAADDPKKGELIKIDQLSLRAGDAVRVLDPEAGSLMKELFDACREHLGEDHPKTLLAQGNVAVEFANQGDMGKSVEMLEDLMEKMKKRFGERDPRVVRTSFQLASSYSIAQRKSDADVWFAKALSSVEEIGLKGTKDLAYGIQLYGRHLKRFGQYEEARIQLEKSLEILEAKDFDDPGLVNSVRIALVDTNQALGNDGQARKMLSESERSLPKSRVGSGMSYDVQFAKAIQLLRDGETEAALKALDEAESLAIKISGKLGRPFYAVTQSKFLVHAKLENKVEAGRLLKELGRIEQFRSQTLFGAYSLEEQFRRSASSRAGIDRAIYLLNQKLIDVEDAYKNVIMAKGLLTDYQRRQAFIRRNPSLHAVAQQLKELNRTLTATLIEGKPLVDQTVDELLDRRDSLHQKIAVEVPAVSESPDELFEMIVGKLAPGSALIDFIEYTDLASESDAAQAKRLCAFSLTPRGEVRFVKLGAVSRIEALLSDWLKSMDRELRVRARSSIESTRNETHRLGSTLRYLVLDPIYWVGDLPERLMISPDGPLAACPFSALPGATPNSYVVESSSITYAIAPRLFFSGFNRAEPSTPNKSLLVVGDIDYGARAVGSQSPMFFSQVPNATKTIDSVIAKFRDRYADAKVARLTGSDAGETAVGDQLPGRSHIHFHTHGFALAPRGDQRTSQEGYAIGMSGLALSDANLVLDRRDSAPGILWADELASVDLTNAELVVLAACETTPGLRVLGEGQLGIQRALTISGAGASVSTLRSVINQPTIDLMDHFYHYLLVDPHDSAEALRRAKVAMLNGGRDVKKKPPLSQRPPLNLWAPFVLYGQVPSATAPSSGASRD